MRGCWLRLIDNPGEDSLAWDGGCASLRNLVVLVWADAAGLLPPEASLVTWGTDKPDFFAFDSDRTGSGIVDVGAIYASRSEEPQSWNDLLRYYENVGEPYLYSTDLGDVVALTEPEAPEDDEVGWGACPPALTGTDTTE